MLWQENYNKIYQAVNILSSSRARALLLSSVFGNIFGTMRATKSTIICLPCHKVPGGLHSLVNFVAPYSRTASLRLQLECFPGKLYMRGAFLIFICDATEAAIIYNLFFIFLFFHFSFFIFFFSLSQFLTCCN